MTELEKATKKHIEVFGVEPVILDSMNDPIMLSEYIIDSINKGVPYNERDDYSDKELQDLDSHVIIY